MPSVRIRNYLRSLGAQTGVGVAIEDATTFARRVGCPLPDAMTAFYRHFDGAHHDEPEPPALSVWPLHEVALLRDIGAAYGHQLPYLSHAGRHEWAGSYLVFADAMVWTVLFAVSCAPAAEPGGPVIRVGPGGMVTVAGSFNEFWEQYLRDPGSVLRTVRAAG